MKLLFVFGAGYSATALARQMDPAEWNVTGTSRAMPQSDSVGMDIHAPIERVQWLPGMPWPDAAYSADALLFSIPPGEEGDYALNLLPKTGIKARWAGYLSTTGVYGDLAGGWAFEDNPVRPQSLQAHKRVLAERQALASALPMHIFRLPGIYGPGRSALDRLREGRAQALVKPGHVFSRVHVADIAGTLLRSIASPNPGRIYNVADDCPCAQSRVLNHAADLLDLPRPEEVPFAKAELSHGARRFYAESRRISNARIKAELGMSLQFPDYIAGLNAIHSTRSSVSESP